MNEKCRAKTLAKYLRKRSKDKPTWPTFYHYTTYRYMIYIHIFIPINIARSKYVLLLMELEFRFVCSHVYLDTKYIRTIACCCLCSSLPTLLSVLAFTAKTSTQVRRKALCTYKLIFPYFTSNWSKLRACWMNTNDKE